LTAKGKSVLMILYKSIYLFCYRVTVESQSLVSKNKPIFPPLEKREHKTPFVKNVNDVNVNLM